MSDGSTTSKKSRSTSDAERRQRRAQRILNGADKRLARITATYSANTLSEPSTGTSPFASRRSSPQPSQKSSPVTSESPESPFRTRRNTGNLEPLSDSPVELTAPTPNQSTPSSTSSTQLLTSLDDDGNEPFNQYIQDDDYIRRILENFKAKNGSTTSLESSGGTSEFQYHPSTGGYPLMITPEDSAVQQEILQSQQIPPFPFQSLFPFNTRLFPPSGDGRPQFNLQSKLWQLIHFSAMILLALMVIYREKDIWGRLSRLSYSNPDDITDNEMVHSVSLFWYFVTVELVLQSSRLLLQKDRTFQGSTLGSLAANLPSPFSDVLKIFLRYNLIWNSLWEDICILVFIVGFTIMISPILSSVFGK